MIRRSGGLGVRRRVWHRDSPVESRTRDLHALLDRALSAGVAPVEVESGLADLLSLAKRRQERAELVARADGAAGRGLPPADPAR